MDSMPTSSYRIVDYDPLWPEQFKQEKFIIVSVLGTRSDSVEL